MWSGFSQIFMDNLNNFRAVFTAICLVAGKHSSHKTAHSLAKIYWIICLWYANFVGESVSTIIFVSLAMWGFVANKIYASEIYKI